MSRKQQEQGWITSSFLYNQNDDDTPASGHTTPRGPSPPLSDTQSYITALESPVLSVVGSDGRSESTEEYNSAEEDLMVSEDLARVLNWRLSASRDIRPVCTEFPGMLGCLAMQLWARKELV